MTDKAREKERQKALEFEKRRTEGNSSPSRMRPKEVMEEGEFYNKESRDREEQLDRIAQGIPVNASSHEFLKGFDAELAEKATVLPINCEARCQTRH